jgi:hypothetical protein
LHGKRRGRWLAEEEIERLSGLFAEWSEMLGLMVRRKAK